MSWDFEAPDSVDNNGQFLDADGTYHLSVIEVEQHPTRRDGTPIEGALRIKCEVLAGTVESQVGRTVGVMFFSPNPASKDGGEFQRRIVCRWLIAVGIVDGRAAPGARMQVDPQQAVGRQFVARFKTRDGSEYPGLDGANIWHVDDPAAAAIPKSESALKERGPAERRGPEFFAALSSKKGGAGAPAKPSLSQAPHRSGVPATAAAGAGGFDDI